jgi:hypothetical protein
MSEFDRIHIVQTENMTKVESTNYSFQNEAAAADCRYFYLQPKPNGR